MGYSYYLCRGRLERLKPDATAQCTARYIPVADLDKLVWQDLCQVLRDPTLITHELERARAGEWLPQALRARQKTVTDALAQLERQLARLLDIYLAEIITRAEFERKHHDLTAQQEGLRQQQRQLEAQAQQHLDVIKLTNNITALCNRLQATLDQLDFAQCQGRRTFGSFGCLVIEHFGRYTEVVLPPLSGSTDGHSLDTAPRPGAPAARIACGCFRWQHLNLCPCLHADDHLLPVVRYGDHTRP